MTAIDPAADVLVLWRYHDASKLEGYVVCPSPIDDHHLTRCAAVSEIAAKVGLSYSDTMRVLVDAGTEYLG